MFIKLHIKFILVQQKIPNLFAFLECLVTMYIVGFTHLSDLRALPILHRIESFSNWSIFLFFWRKLGIRPWYSRGICFLGRILPILYVCRRVFLTFHLCEESHWSGRVSNYYKRVRDSLEAINPTKIINHSPIQLSSAYLLWDNSSIFIVLW